MSTYEALRACLSVVEAADEALEAIAAGTLKWTPEAMAVARAGHKDARLKALAVMEEEERVSFCSDNPLKIVRWLSSGEMDDGGTVLENTNDLYEVAGRLLDKACSSDILGSVAFEADNGKVYVMNVAGCIGEIDPDYLEQLEQELADEAEDDYDGDATDAITE